jgi:YcaO cyclodehydratase, ATP-ad Mg2+-binding
VTADTYHVPALTERIDSRITLSGGPVEVIVTVLERVFAFPGRFGNAVDAETVMELPQIAAAVREARRKRVPADVSWVPNPQVWSDAPLRGGVEFHEPEELSGLISTGRSHAYALSFRRPYALLEGLTRPPGATQLTPVLRYGGSILVGPTFANRGWPCPRCWRRRLLAGTPSLRERVARRHTMVTDDAMPEDVLLLARTMWEAPHPRHSPFSVLDIDTVRGTLTEEAMLPFPDCSCSGGDPLGKGDRLDGRWVAPVRVASAKPADIGEMIAVDARRPGNPSIGGTGCDHDESLAQIRAISETLESGAAILGGQLRPTLLLKGNALPDSVRAYAPYSAGQYSSPGFPYSRVEAEAEYLALPAIRLADGTGCALPAQLCTLQRLPDEPRIAARSSTGISLADNPMTALERSLLEMCERDLVTRHWFGGEALEVANPYRWLPRKLGATATKCFIRAAVITASSALCPTVVIFVAPDGQSAGALGSACELSLATAMGHAFRDATIMYRHRLEHDALVSSAVWPELEVITDDWWSVTGSMQAVVAHYDPFEADLTTLEVAAAGSVVSAVWSPRAVDFPRPGQPLPLGSAPHLATFSSREPDLWVLSGAFGSGRAASENRTYSGRKDTPCAQP